MKKTSSISKDNSNPSKQCFGYHCRNLVNYKNLVITFWNIWLYMVRDKVKVLLLNITILRSSECYRHLHRIIITHLLFKLHSKFLTFDEIIQSW